MAETMSAPWIPSAFTMSDEFKEKILSMAVKFPQAFMIRPKGNSPNGTFAKYSFDNSVDLFVDTSHDEAIEFYKQKFSEEKDKTMSTALTTTEQGNVKQLLYNNIQAIQSVLPHHMPKEKMLRTAYQVIVLNPKLARDCDQLSLLNAVLEASALGLEIGGPLAQAHLVPFKGKVKLIPDYKGLIELAYRSPKVTAFTARPVYANDKFEYWYGLKADLIHTPFRKGSRGQLLAAYAIVKFSGGGIDFEVVEYEDAMAAKESSPAKKSNDSPWNKPADEWTMWVKTAVKRLLKRVPKSPDLQRALSLENSTDEDQSLNHIINADFKNMDDLPPGEPKTELPPPEKEPEPPKEEAKEVRAEFTSEGHKIIKNYEVAVDAFPVEHRAAVKDLGFVGEIRATEDMDAIMKRISAMLDEQAM